MEKKTLEYLYAELEYKILEVLPIYILKEDIEMIKLLNDLLQNIREGK